MRLIPSCAARTGALSLVLLLGVAACQRAPVAAPAPTPSRAAPPPVFASGQAVVAAMRARYAGKWFNTLTFRQKTSRLRPNGTWDVQTWYEELLLPGRLRIDFEPVSAGNGVLYARDSQFVASNGRVIRAEPGINDLLLLGFDVYANPLPKTEALLVKQGFDLARVHQDSLDGRAMLVVGALPGEEHRKQFWVDAERLLFVRLLESDPRDSTKVQDIRFVNYEKRGDAWLSPRVEIHSGGKLTFYEDYFDMRTDVPLDESIFDPTPWKNPKNWVR
jgi:hypothetical protein